MFSIQQIRIKITAKSCLHFHETTQTTKTTTSAAKSSTTATRTKRGHWKSSALVNWHLILFICCRYSLTHPLNIIWFTHHHDHHQRQRRCCRCCCYDNNHLIAQEQNLGEIFSQQILKNGKSEGFYQPDSLIAKKSLSESGQTNEN